MNQEVVKLWTEALRGGKHPAYSEITVENAGALHCGEGFCILGVICDLHREKFSGEWKTNPFNKHLEYLKETAFLPAAVLTWMEIVTRKPTMAHYIAARNDENEAYALANPDLALLVEWMSLASRKTFAEMADIIEGKPEEKKCESLPEPQSISTQKHGIDSSVNPDLSAKEDTTPAVPSGDISPPAATMDV